MTVNPGHAAGAHWHRYIDGAGAQINQQGFTSSISKNARFAIGIGINGMDQLSDNLKILSDILIQSCF